MAAILVVDDSQVDRLLIGGLLEGEPNVEVTFACDGAEALERLGDMAIDLVITDLVMPEVDGLDLVKRLRELHPNIPTVLVTSQGSEEVAVTALRSGAASYVPKASLAEDLVDTVETVLEASRQERRRSEVLGSMISGCYSWELANDRTLFSPLISYLQENLAGFGLCDETERTRMGVALEEALVNAAEHGNLELDSHLRQNDRKEYVRLLRQRLDKSPYCDRKVRLEASLSKEKASFVVRDEGTGFDPRSLPDPTKPENLLKASGRGVMLMRTFMDEVVYNDTGNEVTLIKLSSEARAELEEGSEEAS